MARDRIVGRVYVLGTEMDPNFVPPSASLSRPSEPAMPPDVDWRAKTIRALDQLHQPIDRDGPTPQACRSCVAGYDPATGQLVNCAWPCQSARILQAGHHG